jgi:hypothetical protein
MAALPGGTTPVGSTLGPRPAGVPEHGTVERAAELLHDAGGALPACGICSARRSR